MVGSHDNDLYKILVKQQHENAVSEIFASYSIQPSVLMRSEPVEYYLHIALVKELPELPPDIDHEDVKFWRS
jgi:hypothetical protein